MDTSARAGSPQAIQEVGRMTTGTSYPNPNPSGDNALTSD